MTPAGTATPRLEPVPGLPRWREVFAGVDWLSLRASAVYYGFGVPRGDGSPVVLVPGFMAADRRLMELYYWLIRVGYRPYYSGAGAPGECPDVRLQSVLSTVARVQRRARRPVRLIGHSLGGTIARAAAVLRPERVSQVIALGSPIRSARVHPSVLETVRRLSPDGRRRPECYTEACGCDFVRALVQAPPPSVARAAIYSRDDGVVEWRCCREEKGAANIEVKGSHSGLAFNPQVYRELARLLAEAG